MFNKRKGNINCGDFTGIMVIFLMVGILIMVIKYVKPYRPDYYIYDGNNKQIHVVYNDGTCTNDEEGKISCSGSGTTYYIPKGSTVKEVNNNG